MGAPAVATHVDTVIAQEQALGPQACTLLGAGGAVGGQAQASARGEYAMPGQAGIVGKLAEGTAYPACRTAQAGQGGQLAIGDHLACRDGCQR